VHSRSVGRSAAAAALSIVLAFSFLGAAGASRAGATVPGTNGLIAFERMAPPFIPSGDIYTIEPNGTGIRRLTFGGTGMFPAWSPDGRRIAYSGPADPTFAIWIMGADGSDPHQLTFPGSSSDLRPAWSPDGRRIVFDRLYGAVDVLWIMNADGSDLRRLHRGSEPSWSPNGRWIAFTGLDGVRLIRPNGRGIRRVAAGMAEHPSWSPNGRWIAYAGPGGIWIVNAAGNDRRRVTHAAVADRMPAWAPDGSRIVFSRSSDVGSGGTHLWTIKIDGSGARRVTSHADRIDWNAAWQPLHR